MAYLNPLLNDSPEARADADAPLFAGPTALLTGLPSARHPAHWRSGEVQPNMDQSRIPESAVHAGSGLLLFYDDAGQLLAHTPAWLHLLADGAPEATPQELRIDGLTRRTGYWNAWGWPELGTGSVRGGVAIRPPQLAYTVTVQELDNTVITAAPSDKNTTDVTPLRAGTVTDAYLVLTTDAYGEALPDVPSLSELDGQTPNALSQAAPERDLAWVHLPLGNGDGLIEAASAQLDLSSRLRVISPFRFDTGNLPVGRPEAAYAAFAERLRYTGDRFTDAATGKTTFGNACRWDTRLRAYYIERTGWTSRPQPVDVDQHQAFITHMSGILSSVRLPPQGKYYFELSYGGAHAYNLTTCITSVREFQSWNGWRGTGPVQFCHRDGNHWGYISPTATLRVLVDRDTGTVTFMGGEAKLSQAGDSVYGTLSAEHDRIAVVRAGSTGSDNQEGGHSSTTLRTTDSEFVFDRPMGYQCLPELKDRQHQDGPYPYEEVMDWLTAQASDANTPVLIDRSTPDSYQFARESVILSALSLPERGKFYFEVDLPTDVGYPLAEGETEVTSGNPYVTLALVPEGFTPSLTDELRATGHPTFHLYDHLDEAMAAGTLKVLVDKDAGTVSWQLGELTIGEGSYITTAIPQGSASRVMAGIVGAGQAGQYGTLRFRFREEDFTGVLPEGYQPLPWSFSRA